MNILTKLLFTIMAVAMTIVVALDRPVQSRSDSLETPCPPDLKCPGTTSTDVQGLRINHKARRVEVRARIDD
jgi:hypothetical protein